MVGERLRETDDDNGYVTKSPAAPKDVGGIQSAGVPPWRFYLIIFIMAVVSGSTFYFMGKMVGKSETKYEAAKIDLEKQKEVFVNDLQIETDSPDSNDIDAWSIWMRNNAP